MREHWPREMPALDIDAAGVALLLEPLFGTRAIESVTQVAGGLTNTNLRVRLAGRSDDLLLHLYQRGPEIARTEVALMRHIGDRVPVQRLRYFADQNPLTGHAYAVFDWVDGRPLDAVLALRDDLTREKLGVAVGRILAAVHGFSFAVFGFFGADLEVKTAIDFDPAALVAHLHHCLVEGRGGARLGADLTARLLAFAVRDGARLADWPQSPGLIHGDFSGANVLVRAADGGAEVAAVLDWEYALSGPPALDFGNLLRPPLGAMDAFVAGLAAGYGAAGGTLPAHWQQIARVADLFAWADILQRPQCSAAVIADAQKIIGATIGA